MKQIEKNKIAGGLGRSFCFNMSEDVKFFSLKRLKCIKKQTHLKKGAPADIIPENERRSVRKLSRDSLKRSIGSINTEKVLKRTSLSLSKSFKSKRITRSLANLATLNNQELTNETNLTSSTIAVPDCIEVSTTKQLSIGKKKFNIDPKKGISYLVDNSLIEYDAKDIAQFLLTGEGLNKSTIGQYLCTSADFNRDVLNEFINLQNFQGLVILQALREFMWSFHPSGDSQKIDRVLRGFSTRYYEQNTSVLEDAEQCYNLAFTIILLNTLLHNPAVKEKPTKEMFQMMLKEDGEYPSDLVEQIYDSVKAEPFKKSDGDDLMHTFFNPDREGWLWKQGGRYKSWKRRWFILTEKCLYYFEYTTDKVPRGIIPLENIKIREANDRKMGNCFEIFNESSDIVKACKSCSSGKMVEGRHRKYKISAVSAKEKAEWMEAIRKNTLFSPFYELLSNRS